MTRIKRWRILPVVVALVCVLNGLMWQPALVMFAEAQPPTIETPTAIETSTPAPSPTDTATLTLTSTGTPTATPTSSLTPTATSTPTPTPTASPTSSPTPTAISTRTLAPTITATSTPPLVPPIPASLTEPIVIGVVVVIVMAVLVILIIMVRRGRRPPLSDVALPPPPAPPPVVSQKQCPHCNMPNQPNARFCKSCGKPLQLMAATPTRQLSPITAPVDTKADAQPLAILPDGAVIGDKRYRVLKLVHQSKQMLNRYQVGGLHPVIRCANCSAENPPDSQFCSGCGTPVAGTAASPQRYLLKESTRLDRVQTEYNMAEKGLAHNNLIPPRDAFEEKINDTARYYVVLDEVTWGTAAQVTPPQELPLVLSWGIGLADGLAYLHQQQIVMNRISGGEVALIGRVAQWANFETARAVSTEEWQQSGTQLIAEDVRQLAVLIYRLATGAPQYDPNNRVLTPKVNAVFVKALDYMTAAEFAAALRDVETYVRRPGGIDVYVARLSDVGQERDLDEDSILTMELGQVYRSASMPLGLYAVADGMGGHEGGDVASQLAIRTIARRAVNSILMPALTDGAPALDYEAWIKEAVLEANQAVLTQRKASRNDMGTTLVMAMIINDLAYIAHVGDSRAYLIRNEAITQLTVDHSLVERLVATGQISREEAATHPQRNVIYKNIGDKPQVEPDIQQLTLLPGDRLLLCCDGLSGEIGDAVIKQIVQDTPSLPEACQRLIKAANEMGGHDNISVVLIGVVATG